MFLLLICIIAGFFAVYSFLSTRFKELLKIESLVIKWSPIVGLVSIFIGVWHFFSPSHMGDGSFFGSLDFVGDFIPATLAILVGFVLNKQVFRYINFSTDYEKAQQITNKIQATIDQYRIFLGFTTIVFGILHLFDIIGKGYPFL